MSDCRSGWSKGSCDLGIAAGYVGDSIWFIVLLPQIYKNFQRKSTDGLSLLWALFNFTAGLINSFSVFLHHQPILSRVIGCYFPILEAYLLIQFYLYLDNSKYLTEREWHKRKLFIFGFAWIAIFCVESIIIFGANSYHRNHILLSTMQWFATILWCIELIPQLYINFRERTVVGQSFLTVLLLCIGKTADFANSFLLDVSFQSAILAYFSASISYMNIMQFIYYTLLSVPSTSESKFAFEPIPFSMSAQTQQIMKWLGLTFFSGLLLLLDIALIWRTSFNWIYILCPIVLYCVIYMIFSIAVSHQSKLRATAVLQHFFNRNSAAYLPLIVAEEK